jgi:cytochrome c553
MDSKRLRVGTSVLSIAAAVFLGIALAATAQNPGGGAPNGATPQAQQPAFPNLPLWAYPVNQGRGGPGGGAGRGPGGGGNFGGGGAPGGPGAAGGPGGAPGGAPGAARGAGRGPVDDGSLKHVPGSDVGLTQTQIRSNGMYGFPDWFPNTHEGMPDIVAKGNNASGVQACAYCHLPTGQGRPENESITGLPAGYILQQLSDFKNGLRKGSDPRMGFTFMVRIGTNISDEDAKTAANYFASLKPRPWIRVVEADTVPVTRAAGGMLAAVDGGGTEPIGQRIIVVSEDYERTELRDPSSGFIAYVPKGSIAKGKVLVTTGGNGKTIPCAICHGEGLKGIGNVPALAGRDPSQMARQIIDIQNGVRTGPYSQLMKEPVRQLTNDDIVNILAYTASLQP